MPKLEFIERNVEIARTFKPMTDAERRKLSAAIAEERKLSHARFFRNHTDA